jgi:hypothetical protein
MTRSQTERRSDAEPDAAAGSAFRVARVRPRSGSTQIAGALWALAALIVVAIVKPWGVDEPAAVAPVRPLITAMATEAPVPTIDLSADGVAASFCLGPGSWRVASLETWRTQDVRVWRAIEPVLDATGPLDPAIPSVPIVAVTLAALGWCAPAYGDGRPAGPAFVTAWHVRDGMATALGLRQVRPASGTSAIGALYVPLARCHEVTTCASLLPEPGPAPWSTGHVVFRYVDEGLARSHWFAADIEILALAESPSTAPGAKP